MAADHALLAKFNKLGLNQSFEPGPARLDLVMDNRDYPLLCGHVVGVRKSCAREQSTASHFVQGLGPVVGVGVRRCYAGQCDDSTCGVHAGQVGAPIRWPALIWARIRGPLSVLLS